MYSWMNVCAADYNWRFCQASQRLGTDVDKLDACGYLQLMEFQIVTPPSPVATMTCILSSFGGLMTMAVSQPIDKPAAMLHSTGSS